MTVREPLTLVMFPLNVPIVVPVSRAVIVADVVEEARLSDDENDDPVELISKPAGAVTTIALVKAVAEST